MSAERVAIVTGAGRGLGCAMALGLARACCRAEPTLTGVVPDSLPQNRRESLLYPGIMVAPLMWLISEEADGVSGCRLSADRWQDGNPSAAIEKAGWGR